MALRAEPVRHQPTTVETARKSNGNGTEKESKRNGRKIIFLLTYRKRIRRYRCGGRHRRIHFETSRDRFVLLRPILFCFFFGICLSMRYLNRFVGVCPCITFGIFVCITYFSLQTFHKFRNFPQSRIMKKALSQPHTYALVMSTV